MTLPCLPADAARNLVQRVEIDMLRRERLIAEIKANIADIDKRIASLHGPAFLGDFVEVRERAVCLLREAEGVTGGVA